MIDYGRSFYMPGENDGNNLYISITGRMKIQSENGEQEFIAVKDHPREHTFDDSVPAYSVMVKEFGASFIGFIFNRAGDAIINRRSNLATGGNFQNQCVDNLYSKFYKYDPRKVKFSKELKNPNEIHNAALKQKRILVRSKYNVDGRSVILEYQAGLINFKSDSDGGVRHWQLVSDIVPLYVGGDFGQCGSIKQGYIAIRQFEGPNEAIYLCADKMSDKNISFNDYKCVIRLDVKSNFFTDLF